MKKKLKIAQVAPLWIPVPPQKYGGIELIIYYLCEGLVKKGHDVTLFASGDSKTSAKLIPIAKKSLLKEKLPWTFVYYNLFALCEAIRKEKSFDLIHTHIDLAEIFFTPFSSTPVIHTIHNPLYVSSSIQGKHRLFLLKKFKNNNFITISKSQKKLCPYNLNFVATVYNGINIKNFKFNKKPKNYFLWAARIDKYKGIEEAIKIAKKANINLVLAGRLDEIQKEYFNKKIKPLIDNKKIKFIGEYKQKEKSKIFGNAKGFLYPIKWHEPFGLVMVESMACGTPVIAFNRGSVPEIVKHGKTGFVVNNIKEAVEAVKKIDTINREDCRKWVEEKFTVERMVDEYEKVYYKILEKNKKI